MTLPYIILKVKHDCRINSVEKTKKQKNVESKKLSICDKIKSKVVF